MALQQTYGVTSWAKLVILTSFLFLAGCSLWTTPEPQIKTVTKIERIQIPTVARPKPLQLSDTRVFVVTKDNYEEFVKEFEETYGEVAYVALSMKDYENLALNIADIKRFLEQQEQIIVYYEKAVKEEREKNDTPNGETSR